MQTVTTGKQTASPDLIMNETANAWFGGRPAVYSLQTLTLVRRRRRRRSRR